MCKIFRQSYFSLLFVTFQNKISICPSYSPSTGQHILVLSRLIGQCLFETRRLFRTQSYITEICDFEYLLSLLFRWQKQFFFPIQSNIKTNWIFSPTVDFFSEKIHLFAPIHMISWLKSKLGQVQVGSNIAQNIRTIGPNHYSWRYCISKTWGIQVSSANAV